MLSPFALVLVLLPLTVPVLLLALSLVLSPLAVLVVLSPLTALLVPGMPVNEIKEVTNLFMANGFNVDLTRQPELAEVKGGSEGIAGPGDLLFIPCGMIHSLASTGDMVSIGWIPTKIHGSRINQLGDCPNPNGKGYNWPPNAPNADNGDEVFDDSREKDPDPDNTDDDHADNRNDDDNGNDNADDDGNGDDDGGDNGDDANSDDGAGSDNDNDANSDNEDDANKNDDNDNHKERARQLEEKNQFLG